MLSGLIVDQMGYLWLEMFFILWLVVALVGTVLVWLIDFAGTGYLNMSVPQRDAHDEAIRVRAEQEARNAARRKEVMRPRTANELRNRPYGWKSRGFGYFYTRLGVIRSRVRSNVRSRSRRNPNNYPIYPAVT
eukprot:maker-scaffold69_size418775-snap-gene-2.23 protein:Tk03258 transcript:maker-scaffold69_size418775-snap-gene-2.23-mRNA-1 annotation:"peptidoglycan-binding protein"